MPSGIDGKNNGDIPQLFNGGYCMNGRLTLSALLLVLSAGAIRSSQICKEHAPVEFQNQRSDITATLRNSASGIETEIPYGVPYVTVDAICQKTDTVGTGKYVLTLTKGTLPPVRVDLNVAIAPSNWGDYKVMDISVPQNSLIGYVASSRAFFNGWWGMGASGEASHIVTLQDGTKVGVKVVVVFESYYRKFKYYIQKV